MAPVKAPLRRRDACSHQDSRHDGRHGDHRRGQVLTKSCHSEMVLVVGWGGNQRQTQRQSTESAFRGKDSGIATERLRPGFTPGRGDGGSGIRDPGWRAGEIWHPGGGGTYSRSGTLI